MNGPSAAQVAAFADRRYRCHRCGAAGVQRRTTDPVPGPARFRLPDGALLLPRCENCTPLIVPDDEDEAVRHLVVAVGTLAVEIEPVPLDVYRCSVASCGVIWHELAVRPPVVPVPDAEMPRHPCPWCLVERPDISRRDHLGLAAALPRGTP